MKFPISALMGLGLALVAEAVSAGPIEPLTAGKKPLSVGTGGLVVNQTALEQMGKALFWDVNVGSFGMACASCHFQAGSDIRLTNMINRGPDGIFGKAPNGDIFGPAEKATPAMFPFHRLANMANRNSEVVFDADDIMGSSGTFAATFKSVTVGTKGVPGVETCVSAPVAGGAIRQQTFRHAPTVINAAFNLRLFSDGSANNRFNGIDTLGQRTLAVVPNAGIIVANPQSPLSVMKINLGNDALASQAMGPPGNGIEMSCAGRTLRDVGKKLLGAKALSTQFANPTDSIFGKTPNLVANLGPGLTKTYAQFVKEAFKPSTWSAAGRFVVAPDKTVSVASNGYTQMEYNFPLFFGLAIQAYERTLISDKSPYDFGWLNASAARGRDLFTGKGKCSNCHDGPLFTSASFVAGRPINPVDRVRRNDGAAMLVDRGFFNIGVRPTREDLSAGDTDPFLTPLAFARQYVGILLGITIPDRFSVNPCGFRIPFSKDVLLGKPCSTVPNAALAANLLVGVDGAFKVPTLRNVALTPPYMHNGGFATLEQVIDFKNRGGDTRRTDDCGGTGNTTGYGANCSNLPAEVAPLGLTAQEKADLVEFLKSLTDNRVACQAGPFDHPSLPLNLGYGAGIDGKGHQKDYRLLLPATGTWGLPGVGKPCFPNSGDLFGLTQTTFTKVLNPLDRP